MQNIPDRQLSEPTPAQRAAIEARKLAYMEAYMPQAQAAAQQRQAEGQQSGAKKGGETAGRGRPKQHYHQVMVMLLVIPRRRLAASGARTGRHSHRRRVRRD